MGAPALVAHLPGKHDQSTHGRKGSSARDFETRAKKAKSGDAALGSAPVAMADVDGSGARGLDTLSGDEQHALMYYRGEGYRKVTPALHRQAKGGTPSAEVSERVGHLDSALGKSPLQDDVVTYRGIRTPSRLVGERATRGDMTGLEWTDPGFLSTSTNASQARQFARQGALARETQPTVMRIMVPKGTGGITLSSGRGGGESEILLPRGQKFRVAADHGVHDGVRLLDVEMVAA